MDINDITIGQAKELASTFGASNADADTLGKKMIGKMVIIRCREAGCWFGKLEEKQGKEVILSDARRMYHWWAAKSISLSAVAKYGIKQNKSKIVEAVDSVWLEAIEVIPCTETAVKSIGGAPNVEAE